LKLTEDDIQVLETDDFLYYTIFGKPEVIKDKAIKKSEQLRQQILSDHEKAEDYPECVEENVRYFEENKKLKEEYLMYKTAADEEAHHADILQEQNRELKEIVEKVKEYHSHIKTLTPFTRQYKDLHHVIHDLEELLALEDEKANE